MAEHKTPKISIGIISLTVILCVLCLTVFSVLTLSTALSERNFSKKRAQATHEYYTAEREATILVNDMIDAWERGEDLSVFARNNQINIDNNTVHFQKQIESGQALDVIVHFTENPEIESWRVISTADWTPDNSLAVWDGVFMDE